MQNCILRGPGFGPGFRQRLWFGSTLKLIEPLLLGFAVNLVASGWRFPEIAIQPEPYLCDPPFGLVRGPQATRRVLP
mgnify:CR=1 FL=1